MPFIEKSDFSTLLINQLGQPPSRVLLCPHRRIWPMQTRLCRPRELGMSTGPSHLPASSGRRHLSASRGLVVVSVPVCLLPRAVLPAWPWGRGLKTVIGKAIYFTDMKKKSIRKDINKPSLTESSSRPFRDVWPWSRYPAINDSTWHG